MSIKDQISRKACIGERVKIGQHAVIYDQVVIEDDCEIGDHTVIGLPAPSSPWAGQKLHIGRDSIIRSHSVLYEGSVFGRRLETGHHVLVREGARCGTHLRIGSYSDVEGDCDVGDFCRFHGYVHVGRGSRIGHFVWLYSQVTLTNDPLPPSKLNEPVVIEDGAVLCVGVTPLPGVRIGTGAFITAGSLVRKSVPAAAVFMDGTVKCGVHQLRSLKWRIAHPWMSHLKDAYPEEAWARIDQLHAEILDRSKGIIPQPVPS